MWLAWAFETAALGVVGGAVDHREADPRRGQRRLDEPHAVGEGEPRPEHPPVARLGEAGADAQQTLSMPNLSQ